MFKRTLPMAVAVAIGLSSAAPSFAAVGMAKDNQFWWPEQIDLSPLRTHDAESNPYGADFDYGKAFLSLDLEAVKKDIEGVLTTSQPWWPADFGHYGPFFIRMAWHSAGTYRVGDGRGGAGGGQQRFDPLNSWPDNGNLDKARRLLWPVKQKYGRSLSWADLMVLAGNVSLESMGFKTFGFAGGRQDDWEPDLVYWGPEEKMLTDKRRTKDGKDLKGDLAAVEMGLIYVNPQGPHGKPDPLAAAEDIRLSFGRMAMNDEEIVALIAGGHTFGKAHGAKKADCLDPEPAAAALEEQGFGWKNKCGKGHSEDTMTSGFEGAWTPTPTAWSILYLDTLFRFDWEKTKSPAGAIQWKPTDPAADSLTPDAHVKGKRNPPMMFTTDIAIKEDPAFRKIAERFMNNPKEFDLAFAKAWFKLTHRDMGPQARYLGSDVPTETLLWQDPLPEADYKQISDRDAGKLKKAILKSGLSNGELIRTALASAGSYRDTDMRGGTNGARVRLAPQKDWPVNNPAELSNALQVLEKVQKDFNDSLRGGKQVSLADVIVLAGGAAVEQAAKEAGFKVSVPFVPGRTDASQEQTDVKSFAVLEPKADVLRNYYSDASPYTPTEAMVDRASLMNLTVPELTALVGGLRVLEANTGGAKHGVFTDKPGALTNDFFVNLLDMSTAWKKSKQEGIYIGYDRSSGEQKWTATPVDLAFGSSSELRSIAEVYASADGAEEFVNDFVAVWVKLMQYGRFDI